MTPPWLGTAIAVVALLGVLSLAWWVGRLSRNAAESLAEQQRSLRDLAAGLKNVQRDVERLTRSVREGQQQASSHPVKETLPGPGGDVPEQFMAAPELALPVSGAMLTWQTLEPITVAARQIVPEDYYKLWISGQRPTAADHLEVSSLRLRSSAPADVVGRSRQAPLEDCEQIADFVRIGDRVQDLHFAFVHPEADPDVAVLRLLFPHISVKPGDFTGLGPVRLRRLGTGWTKASDD
jgi:hypothetical protein